MNRELFTKLVKSELSLESREVIANCMVSTKQDKESKETRKEDKKVLESLQILRKKGYLNIKLPNKSDLIRQIMSFYEENEESIKENSKNEILDLGDISKLSEVQSLINNKGLLSLVELYLGCKPICYRVSSWWQIPQTHSKYQASNAQRWHRDRDDFRFITLFIYLTDVDHESGPHCYLPETHNHTFLTKDYLNYSEKQRAVITGKIHKFLNDNEIVNLFPGIKQKVWVGEAGSAFLEDTRGFHKASIPTKSARLIMQVRWGIYGENC